MARDSKAWLELSRMAGPGFKDMTRLASQDPEMELDVITTNKDGIVHWLDRMQEEIERWKELVQSDEETLFQALHRSNLDREEYIQHGPREPSFQSARRHAGECRACRGALHGPLGRRLREMTKFYEDKAKAAEQVREGQDGRGTGRGPPAARRD